MTVPPKIAATLDAQRLSRCSNAQPGTYGHECGKPATWIGTMPSGWRSGFCASCKASGWEAGSVAHWALNVL